MKCIDEDVNFYRISETYSQYYCCHSLRVRWIDSVDLSVGETISQSHSKMPKSQPIRPSVWPVRLTEEQSKVLPTC